MRPPRIPWILLAVAALGICTRLARADAIVLDPPVPNPSDSIGVTFHGEFPMGCWDVDSRTCLFVGPDSVIVQANIQYCSGNPGCFCTAFPEVYQVACLFPPLPVGTYKAVYREIVLNPNDPRAPVTMTREFTVTGPTGIARQSWGRVKAFYR